MITRLEADMTIVDFLLLVAVAAICGLLGQALAGYSLGGCFVAAIVGFVGAFIGAWLARSIGLPEFLTLSVGGRSFPVVWAVIGSALLVFVLSLFRRRWSF
jgi:uncharacterized membrane protein YeaQ/YmgE (transglycosylase-associated protein family)